MREQDRWEYCDIRDERIAQLEGSQGQGVLGMAKELFGTSGQLVAIATGPYGTRIVAAGKPQSGFRQIFLQDRTERQYDQELANLRATLLQDGWEEIERPPVQDIADDYRIKARFRRRLPSARA